MVRLKSTWLIGLSRELFVCQKRLGTSSSSSEESMSSQTIKNAETEKLDENISVFW